MRALIAAALLCACQDVEIRCTKDEDCPADEYCDERACTGPGCTASWCIARPEEQHPCVADRPELCPAETTCVAGLCLRPQPPGGPCEADEHCAGTALCAGGRCAAPGSGVTGSPCSADAVCGAGLTCRDGRCG